MVSWIDLVGQICNVESGHPLLFQWSQESGNTAGNIMRLLLPSSISGRP